MTFHKMDSKRDICDVLQMRSLRQAKTDVWRELTGREVLARFMSNSFVPTWDEKKRLTVQENVMKCASSLKVDAFAFAPAKEAAETFFKHLKL